MWTCPTCETSVEAAFELCWNCGTSHDGLPDPDFRHADDHGPISDPLDGADLTAEPASELADDWPGPPPEPITVYWARNLMEAQFLTDQLRVRGIAALTGQRRDSRGDVASVVVRAEDAARARLWLDAYDRRRAGRPSDEGIRWVET